MSSHLFTSLSQQLFVMPQGSGSCTPTTVNFSM